MGVLDEKRAVNNALVDETGGFSTLDVKCEATPADPLCLILDQFACPAADAHTDPAQPIPEGYNTVSPYLAVEDAAAAIDYYTKAFGAEETVRMDMPDGKIGHAELKIGEAQKSKPVAAADKAATFTVSLKRGRTEAQTWFRDATGAEIAGAYYVYVRRL